MSVKSCAVLRTRTGVGYQQRKKESAATSRSRALALGDAVACPVKPLRRCVALSLSRLDPSTWPGAMSSRSARPGSSVGDGRTSGGSTRQGTARALFVDDAVYLDHSVATAPEEVTPEHRMTSCALAMHAVSIRVGASARGLLTGRIKAGDSGHPAGKCEAPGAGLFDRHTGGVDRWRPTRRRPLQWALRPRTCVTCVAKVLVWGEGCVSARWQPPRAAPVARWACECSHHTRGW